MKETWLKVGFVLQLVVVVGMLVATYVNVESRLSKIETDISWIKNSITK